MNDLEIAAKDLAARLAAGDAPTLVDVRTPQEWDIARLEGSVLVPLHELRARFGELDPEAELVVVCHHGVRSLQATLFLRHQGFPRVRSLAGGLDAWSLAIDPAVPRY